MQAGERGKSSLKLSLTGRLQQRHSDAFHLSGLLGERSEARALGVARIYQHRDHPSVGDQLGKQIEALWIELPGGDCDTGQVSTMVGEAPHETDLDRIDAGLEDDRDCFGRIFRRARRQNTPACGDHRNLAFDEFGREARQTIEVAFSPARFERHVLSGRPAAVLQPLLERGDFPRQTRRGIQRQESRSLA